MMEAVKNYKKRELSSYKYEFCIVGKNSWHTGLTNYDVDRRNCLEVVLMFGRAMFALNVITYVTVIIF